MSFTKDCYSFLRDREFQNHFVPRNHLTELRRSVKTSVNDRFKMFLQLLSWCGSVGIQEYELFDGSTIFNEDQFNQDIDIALGYINNPAIIKGKVLSMINQLSYEFKLCVKEDSDYTILPEILTGSKDPDEFLNVNQTIKNLKKVLTYTGASGEKYQWEWSDYNKFVLEQYLDILDGASISPSTKTMWEWVNANWEVVLKKYRQKLFIAREVLKFDIDNSSSGTIITFIKWEVFPSTKGNSDIKTVDF